MPYTVLVVDPNQETLASTARAFADAGYLVTTTDSFEAAQPHARFSSLDLLVTDARLGAFNGIHLVIRARANNPEIQAIVVDAAFDPVLERDAAQQGATYLRKPMDPQRLVDAARSLLGARAPRMATARPQRRVRREVASPFDRRRVGSPVLAFDTSRPGRIPRILENASEESGRPQAQSHQRRAPASRKIR